MMTIYNFVKRANEIHNYKYDYSMVKYKNNRTKVTIICPTHGRFDQIPQSHLKYGCKLCAKEKRLKINMDDFLKKAQKIHGFKYDYSKVDYKSRKTNVIIIYPIHGSFSQKPKEHLSGCGCQKCALHKTSLNKFIKQSSITHKNKYDYSKVEFNTLSENIVITCMLHGDFIQKAYNHLRGVGCPYCSGLLASNDNNLFVTHKDLCSEWDYKKNTKHPNTFLPMSTKKVWWKCKNGHEWMATIGSRVKGSGCPFCSGRNPTKNYNLEKIFPDLCTEWGDKNKLPPNNYTPYSCKKVWWKCENGHEWMATISSRSYGNGCPFCSKRISKLCTSWLDKLNIKKREQKIILDGRTFYVDGIKNNFIYEFLGDYWHGNPARYNPLDIHPNIKISFGNILYNTIIKLNILSKYFKVIYRWEYFKNDNIFKIFNIQQKIIIEEAKSIYKSEIKKDIFYNLYNLLGDKNAIL